MDYRGVYFFFPLFSFDSYQPTTGVTVPAALFRSFFFYNRVQLHLAALLHAIVGWVQGIYVSKKW